MKAAQEDEELRDEIESALMHFCELAVVGDPEAELRRSTGLLLGIIKARDDQREREIRIAGQIYELSQSFLSTDKTHWQHNKTGNALTVRERKQHLYKELATLTQSPKGGE